MFDSIPSHLILFKYGLFEIFNMAILSIVGYKLLRFWYRTKVFEDLDPTIFNPKHLVADSDTSELCLKYPNMWYPVIRSGELKRGQAEPVYIFGKDLVVFRTMSGKVHVLDAHCINQGAHLGVGGSVVGEDVQCPLHAWTFNGDGVCTSVPGLENTTLPEAKINSWKSIEMNDLVLVWYHDQGVEPTYFPPKFENIEKGEFCEQHEFYLNNQFMDFYANAIDVPHYDYIHAMSGTVSNDQLLRKGFIYRIMRNVFINDFKITVADLGKNPVQSEEDKWPTLTLTTAFKVFGIRLDFTELQATFKYVPGIIYSHWTSTKFNGINSYASLASTPESPMRWHIFSNFYHVKSNFISKVFTKILSARYMKNSVTEFIILNNKTFLKRPYYTKLDTPQARFLKWFAKNHYSNVEGAQVFQDNVKERIE